MAEDSTIARLAIGRKSDPPLLAPHHVAAAVRLEGLIRRALLGPRLTMSYDPANSGGSRKSGGNAVVELSDTAAQARLKLNLLAMRLSTHCWNVAFDVCGMSKGLQTIETERTWPRRSAKLVLRIALDQPAGHLGLAPFVAAPHDAGSRSWLDARLPLFKREDTAPEAS